MILLFRGVMPIRTLVAFFLILGLWPMTAASQSDALMQAYRQGKALEKAGRYREAIPYYRRVLQFGEREPMTEAGMDGMFCFQTFVSLAMDEGRNEQFNKNRFAFHQILHWRLSALNSRIVTCRKRRIHGTRNLLLGY